jgi:biotin transport system ATP-binding protein
MAQAALGACGLWERRKVFVHSLSGGELRRLSLAGILALDPAVLVLDEPFANLDLDGVRSVLRILRELKAQGKALIVATHELEKVLAMADRVLVLDAGTLAFDGAPGAFLERDLEGWGLRDPRTRSGDIEGLSWLD